MGFKEVLQEDINHVFFNTEEFADTHTWNKREIVAIVDDDDLIAKYSSEFEFLEKGSHLVMTPETSFEKKPGINAAIEFDGNLYTVDEVKLENGMYVIFLNRKGG